MRFRQSLAVLFAVTALGSVGCGGSDGASIAPPADGTSSGVNPPPRTSDAGGGQASADASLPPATGGNGVTTDASVTSAPDVAAPTTGADAGAGPAPHDASVPVTDAGVVSHDAAAVDAAGLPKVTLWVAGDSTASVYGPASAQQGWGEHLADFLIDSVTVNDQGFAGRTVVTFIASSHWTTIENGMKAGDYVMIEFGINDSSTADGRLVSIPDFTTGITTMVDAVLAKGATPILVTPSALQYWVNGTETNAREQPYVDAMKAVATQKSILVDDLNALSVAYLNTIGQTAAMQIYINGDKAHFTLAGASEMAKLITQDLVTIGSPLGQYVQ